MKIHRYAPEDPGYPVQLGVLPSPPPLTTTGPIPPVQAVAIVGSRKPLREAEIYARDLARSLARAGIVVVSGGAKGIDAAAHRGALDEGGATWVVCPSGRNHVVPAEHEELFDEIAGTPEGRLIWPFDDDETAAREMFLDRNRVLVGLASAVVVVQARLASGSRNAANHARDLGRELWVVGAPPWGSWRHAFAGSRELLRHGSAARILVSTEELLESLGVASNELSREKATTKSMPLQTVLRTAPDPSWSDAERAIFSAVSAVATHRDQVVARAGLTPGSAATALLTLVMKDVVVEGPEGFFRRKMVG